MFAQLTVKLQLNLINIVYINSMYCTIFQADNIKRFSNAPDRSNAPDCSKIRLIMADFVHIKKINGIYKDIKY